MIRKRLDKLRKYCQNFKDIENYEEAVQSSERYDLHHRKEIEVLDDGTVVLRTKKELIEMDLYKHRPPEELIFLQHSEHMSLHNTGRKASEETRANLSASHSGDKNPRWNGGISTDRAKYMRIRRQMMKEEAINTVYGDSCFQTNKT